MSASNESFLFLLEKRHKYPFSGSRDPRCLVVLITMLISAPDAPDAREATLDLGFTLRR